jgi:3-phosphoshikimate 1-carboxyvinyltransferase
VNTPRPVEPLAAPPDTTVVVPGSKSITNRALVTAALADGPSTLEGALFADDTEAMLGVLHTLGIELHDDRAAARVHVMGAGGVPAGPAHLDCRMSGTTARFVAPLVALGEGRYVIDGHPQLRARPMGPVVEALRSLGAEVSEEGAPGRLPLAVDAHGLAGGPVRVAGDVSSQFVSGLLLAGPHMARGLDLTLTTGLVSRPYVAMTAAVMAAFGVPADVDGRGCRVGPGRYRGRVYRVEPDASAASYFFAAAAITGGRVRIEGLGTGALQGDLAFVDVLEQMGVRVVRDAGATEVMGTGSLHGVEVDLADLSDTAQTLAAVAVFADTPTRVTGIGFIRAKETNRIAAVVRELRRCGIGAVEEPDGFVVHPGAPHPAVVETYDDHRMAMSFALLGLVAPGIAIADPGCVAKTFPAFWEALDSLRAPSQ